MKLWIENRQVRFKREERENNSRMLEKWELKVETREKGKKCKDERDTYENRDRERR